MRQVLATDYAFAAQPTDQFDEANTVREYAWQQLVRSTAKYVAAERLFRERRDFFREKHRCVFTADTVEMLKDLENDEQFKNAIADAPHFSRRMTAFAELFQAAGDRIDDIHQNTGVER
jgi:5'-deoxynucleotidase YfbR-like HD superfamily hydrolase